ncbi:MAG: endonuclease/exonuclease/phosphatase family protein [Longimicrobiales bacterium]
MILRAALTLVLISGCSAHVPPERSHSEGATTWRAVTYNIRHGRGIDGLVDLERTADVLRNLDPDVVALQEVDNRVERSGRLDEAARLGELLGMHHAFGSFMEYQGGQYGLAVLSRCRMRRVTPLRLTEGNEPRVALAVEIEQPDGSALAIVNVHFDWVRNDSFRFTQATEVAAFLDTLTAPYILAGDFNDEPGSRTLELFQVRAREARKPRDARLTFSSTDPAKEIDFIFAAPADAWSAGMVAVVPETIASDHLPVFAELVLRQKVAAGRRAGLRCVPAARAPRGSF